MATDLDRLTQLQTEVAAADANRRDLADRFVAGERHLRNDLNAAIRRSNALSSEIAETKRRLGLWVVPVEALYGPPAMLGRDGSAPSSAQTGAVGPSTSHGNPPPMYGPPPMREGERKDPPGSRDSRPKGEVAPPETPASRGLVGRLFGLLRRIRR